MIVYQITNNINSKCYIGQTTRGLNIRWKEHVYCSKNNSSYYIHKAMCKNGAENFKIELITSCSSLKIMNNFEETLIRKLKTIAPNGYNLQKGGKNHGFCGETKDKMAKSKGGKSFYSRNLKTNEIVEWLNQCECGRKLGVEDKSISSCLRNKLHRVGNYSFIYKDSGKPPMTNEQIKKVKIKINSKAHGGKSFLVRDLRTDKIVKFNTQIQCAKELNIHRGNIPTALKNKFKTVGNYSFSNKNSHLPSTKREIDQHRANVFSKAQGGRVVLARNLKTNKLLKFNAPIDCKNTLKIGDISKCVSGKLYTCGGYSLTYKDSGELPLTKQEIDKLKINKRNRA